VKENPERHITEHFTEQRCSICGKQFSESSSGWLPFCSARCKQIDVARWLNEFYALSIEREENYNPDTEDVK